MLYSTDRSTNRSAAFEARSVASRVAHTATTPVTAGGSGAEREMQRERWSIKHRDRAASRMVPQGQVDDGDKQNDVCRAD